MSRSKRIKEALPAGATVEELPSSPAPLLLVVSFPVDFICPDTATLIRIKESVEGAFNGQPHPPVVVLAPGMKLEAVLDPRGKQ